MEKAEFPKGVQFDLKDTIDYSEGAIVSKTLHKKEVGNLTLFAFDKSQGLTEHTSPFDATILVVEGNAEILIDSKSHFLSAGEMIIMPANIPHAVNAVEKFKMLLIMIRSEK